MLWRVVSVVGWSGPSARSEPGSSSRTSRSASAGSPVSPVQVAMLPRVRSVSGWSPAAAQVLVLVSWGDYATTVTRLVGGPTTARFRQGWRWSKISGIRTLTRPPQSHRPLQCCSQDIQHWNFAGHQCKAEALPSHPFDLALVRTPR